MSWSPGMLSMRSRGASTKKKMYTADQQKAMKTIKNIERSADAMNALAALKEYGEKSVSLTAKMIQINRALLPKTVA